ncbi:uncharacterized protein F4822DRAFT_105452 [Hypoxylon trugodes]|uniref:uncharacterized protein n=1 Tax=Hypoxylon trugodes TaxID=326681 RepID=UPI002196A6A2|nr:uncharacterized protein F4822DRAFT_105452 [Hypoxylon trugodes]KAI1391787.1 hypothetical protein F4822DRAFT_105452 [Hypoxylon trugodes]
MKAARYSTSRQKACQQCSAAKAKCDRKAGCCARCSLRGLSCSYPQAQSPDRSEQNTRNNSERGLHNAFSTPNTLSTPSGLIPSLERETPAGTDETQNSIADLTQAITCASPTNASSETFIEDQTLVGARPDATSRLSRRLESLDFSDLELFSPINVDDISNRWLNSYIPVPGQKVKDYPATITAFIYRILNSYAATAVRGRGAPPFIHSSQVLPTSTRPPLSTCLSLVRICENPLPGSEIVASDVLGREMNNLYEQNAMYDDVTQLAAFQAYLIYAMVLFFKLNQVSNAPLRQVMMNLQQLACSSSRGGLMCMAEQQRARPRWEAWIVAESKRRTLFTMYLFDSVLSAQDGLQTFLGTELQGLFSSSNKILWRAQSRLEWETAYNIHLADWPEGDFRIDELWPIPAGLDDSEIVERRRRVDRWLEDVDEFGTMLYAVTSCTHGG